MPKKKQRSPNQAPREAAAIQKEYGELIQKVGSLQYMVYAYELDIAALNERLKGINNEFALRQKLDSQKAPSSEAVQVPLPTPVTTETQEVLSEQH